VHEFAIAAFSEVGLDCDDFIEIENNYHRPTEVDALIGDYSKAEQILGWKPSIYAQNLAKLMVRSDLEKTKPGS
jgi:GDPmannose 4,6-dehydratase